MEAKKLMIGNWVKAPLSMSSEIVMPTVDVQILGFKYLELVFRCNLKEYMNWEILDRHCIGIKLTEDWLIKFGFQHLNPIFVISPDNGTTQFRITLQNGGTAALNHPDENGGLKNNDALLMGGNVIIPKCPKYVHELQNLYFALTGKELEIK